MDLCLSPLVRNPLVGIVAFGLPLFANAETGSPLPIIAISAQGTLGRCGEASAGLKSLIDGRFGADSFQEWNGPGSVTIDLSINRVGTTHAIDKVVIVTPPNADIEIPREGSIEVSRDGVRWKEVRTYDFRDAKADGSVFALGFPSEPARFVRFNMKTDGVNAQIGEIQVFSDDGPRVSLIDRGESWYKGNNAEKRYPYHMIDGDIKTFGLHGSSKGAVTLKVEGKQYENGWDSIQIAGRSFSNGLPANPGNVTVLAGDDPENLTEIYSRTFDEEKTNWNYLLEVGKARKEKYVKLEWSKNPDWTSGQPNVQFSEIDVVPVGGRPRL